MFKIYLQTNKKAVFSGNFGTTFLGLLPGTTRNPLGICQGEVSTLEKLFRPSHLGKKLSKSCSGCLRLDRPSRTTPARQKNDLETEKSCWQKVAGAPPWESCWEEVVLTKPSPKVVSKGSWGSLRTLKMRKKVDKKLFRQPAAGQTFPDNA